MNAAAKLSQRVSQADSDEAVRLAVDLVHDFNNILNVIGGYLQLIEENPQSPALVASYLAKARTAVKDSSEMTSKLLSARLKTRPPSSPANSPGQTTPERR